jgi:serine/threonine protein kinase
MTPERWQQVEQLYQEALQQEPSQRSAFLTAACGRDADLYREVESLLRYVPVAEQFIEVSALEVTATMLGGDGGLSLIGHEVGTYKILDLLGMGGTGVVYRAHDTRLERTVAVKVLMLTQEYNATSHILAEARLASRLVEWSTDAVVYRRTLAVSAVSSFVPV